MPDESAEYIHNALELARTARFAYQADPAAAARAAGHEFAAVTPFGANGFVGVRPGHAVVAFRGVDDPRDWLKSLDYKQVDGYGGRVHRGFAAALEAGWAALSDAVAGTDGPLWITGHSMGGALAMLAAQRLHAGGRTPAGTFTFGAPRVFDPVAARAFRPRVYRFVNERDAAPSFPTSGPWHRFAHAGERLVLLPKGGVAFGTRRWRSAVRGFVRGGFPGLGKWLLGSLDDHKLDRYVDNLRATIDLSLPY